MSSHHLLPTMLQMTSNIIRNFARKTQSRLITYYSTTTLKYDGNRYIVDKSWRKQSQANFIIFFHHIIVLLLLSNFCGCEDWVWVLRVKSNNLKKLMQMNVLANIAIKSQKNCNNKAATTRYRPLYDVFEQESLQIGRIHITNSEEKKQQRWCKTNQQ